MARTVHEQDPDVNGATDALFEAFAIGREMQEFAEKSAAGRYLVAEAREQLAAAVNSWLNADDPTSRETAAAHLRGRVAVEILGMIQRAIMAGRQAESVISEREASE